MSELSYLPHPTTPLDRKQHTEALSAPCICSASPIRRTSGWAFTHSLLSCSSAWVRTLLSGVARAFRSCDKAVWVSGGSSDILISERRGKKTKLYRGFLCRRRKARNFLRPRKKYTEGGLSRIGDGGEVGFRGKILDRVACDVSFSKGNIGPASASQRVRRKNCLLQLKKQQWLEAAQRSAKRVKKGGLNLHFENVSKVEVVVITKK